MSAVLLTGFLAIVIVSTQELHPAGVHPEADSTTCSTDDIGVKVALRQLQGSAFIQRTRDADMQGVASKLLLQLLDLDRALNNTEAVLAVSAYGCSPDGTIKNISACINASQALNKTFNDCCYSVDTLPYGCTLRADGEIVFNSNEHSPQTYETHDLSAICSISTTTTTTAAIQLSFESKVAGCAPDGTIKNLSVCINASQALDKAFNDCCHSVDTLPYGCTLRADGEVLFNGNEHSPATYEPSNLTAVCMRIITFTPKFIESAREVDHCPSGYVRVTNATICEELGRAELFGKVWGETSCGFTGVSAGCFTHPFGNGVYFRREDCPEATTPMQQNMTLVCMLNATSNSTDASTSNSTNTSASNSTSENQDGVLTADEIAVLQ